MRPEEFIGRVSDGIPALLTNLRSAVGEAAGNRVGRIGGAVLEYRLLYIDWPRAGDHWEIRSGLAEIGFLIRLAGALGGPRRRSL
jgi:acyl-CoA thioester hydrolase